MMKWNPAATTDALSREARRILDAAQSMSNAERESLAGALSEIAWSVAMTQPWPVGNEFSLSAECLDLFRSAAAMAERERREYAYARGTVFSALDWKRSGGVVVPFPAA